MTLTATNATISEIGISLILLEQEAENNMRELYRWQNRRNEAEAMLNQARDRLEANMALLRKLKQNLTKCQFC